MVLRAVLGFAVWGYICWASAFGFSVWELRGWVLWVGVFRVWGLEVQGVWAKGVGLGSRVWVCGVGLKTCTSRQRLRFGGCGQGVGVGV